jgi:hypothetical protein
MTLRKTLLAAAVGVGTLVVTSMSASAYVACTGNVCWHVSERHNYPRGARVVIHEDTWKPSRGARIEFREHEGRGYWRGREWRDF